MTVPITHPLKQAEMCCFHPNIPVLTGVLGPQRWSVPWEVGLGQFQASVGTQLSLTRPTGLAGQALVPGAQRGRALRGLGHSDGHWYVQVLTVSSHGSVQWHLQSYKAMAQESPQPIEQGPSQRGQ